MSTQGYYRYPTVFNETVIFVSEGDLWHLPLVEKGTSTARRLTYNKGSIKAPVFSPDGKTLAFSSTDEGHSELYTMPAEGGEITRLTYMGDDVTVLSWTKDGIYFSSSYGQPFLKWNVVWKISPQGGVPEKLNIGPANFISFKGDKLANGAVIQRHGYREYGYWKRYRGGTAGDLWIDQKGTGTFEKLVDLKGDLARPIWVPSACHKDGKIVFSSDHEGIGNLYACTPDGKTLERLTNHTEYYVRNQSSDGKTIVYHAGADLWALDLATGKDRKLDISYYSDRPERARKFFAPTRYLQGYDLHPKGSHLSVVTRGKACTFGNWDGPVLQFGAKDGIRYRLPKWLHDGKRVLVVNDDAGDESLEIYDAATSKLLSKPKKKIDIGRVLEIWVNPKGDSAVLFNHRSDVLFVDLKKWKMTKVDNSEFSRPGGGDWSPDGKWFTYSVSIDRPKMAVKLFEVKTKKVTQISTPILVDESPVFDPEGKYIYFLSHRHFDPVHDALHFELSFMYATKLYAIPLSTETTSPFLKLPEALFEEEEEKEVEEKGKKKGKKNEEKEGDSEKEIEVKIDLKGIEKRLFEFPIEAGIYGGLCAIKGKVYYVSCPVEGAFEAEDHGPESATHLECFDFESLKTDSVGSGLDDIQTNLTKTHLLTLHGKRLRVFKGGVKPEEEPTPAEKSGWINLARVKLMVTPCAEWAQMYKEAWRLQRDQYWVEDMADIDWQKVFDRYEPLIERVSTRDEFTDIVWEMQGELGTSHAYSFGGDVKPSPRWSVGALGADFTWDKKNKAYVISNISEGDSWDPDRSSPLTHPGINLVEGDFLFSINKETLSETVTPYEVLLHKAAEVIELEVAAQKTPKKRRSVFLKTLRNQYPTRYRDWVEKNRDYVTKKTKGKVGYIHIPDMSSWGYAEFHRSFLQEVDKEGLIVDVRFNGGGNVSQLLLEKLARRRLGYDVTRWNGMAPYPDQAPMGPMVALTNEYAGSDGDMFSHNFKLMNLGPLIGKRTWGGVIGIWPRHGLVDGGMTTQPEFSFWFKDIGWNIENYGVDPDIEVEFKPQDYAKGLDPQLDCGLKELDKLIKKHDEKTPDIATKPSLKLPRKLA